ncbi:uncharacterized protein LOC117318007 [Pecten maximus]|uniref:uncharacterized protein LOC117318007 n=1 Tax=Pecten maximus TaxID=6579 RepID=UPI001457E6E5|nr:uncharacterized protein LOC117318007 [Pecten maximus]
MQPVKTFAHAHVRMAHYHQSHNSYEHDDPNSPRSMNSELLQDQDNQISHLDSVSQTNLAFNFPDTEEHHHHYIQNKTFQDTEEVRRHYIQNNTNGINSPRSAKYRNEASSKAKLAKIITVPGGEDQNHLKYQSSTPRSGQTHGETQKGIGTHKSPTQGIQIPQGSVRGMPVSPGSRKTVPHTNMHVTGQASATFPGSVRGYSKANGHLTHSRRRTPSTDTKGSSVAFRRHHPERKEYYVTQFDIEFDKHERHRFLPGEELTGKIIFDISNEMDVRFIELLILGQTTATLVQQESGVSTTKRDVFLSKRSYIIGTPDGRWTSLITPGHYVSNFRLQLPESIPTSCNYQDKINGFNMETMYLVKARICDDVGASSSARSTHSMNNFVKVLVSRKQIFHVKRPFDIHSVPMAMTPISHVEDVPITCSIFSIREPANIQMSLDRSCFLAGDDIKIHLETENRYANRIKKITCVLRQTVSVKGVRSKAQFNIANVEEKYPEGTITKTNKRNLICYEIHLPTHTNFLPSVMPGCRLVTITYSLNVSVKFTTCGGKLMLYVPINLGPCTDPIHLDKTSSVPFFNRPLRFPHFSPHSNGIANGDAQKVQKRPVSGPPVTSKFSYGACSSRFCCCWGDNTLI